MNAPNAAIRKKIGLLIDEMEVVLNNLKSDSFRSNPKLRDQAIGKINEIQKKIHELKIQEYEANLLK